MRVRWVLSVGSCVMLAATAVDAGSAPVAVSPGDPSKPVQIADVCPTFSWGHVDGARAYNLVVYRLETEREEAKSVLQRRIPGSASSWTPSLDRCLEPGGRYAWTVRTEGDKVASEWAAPSFFRIAPLPNLAEMRRTLELLQRLVAAAEAEIDHVSQSPPVRTQAAPPAGRRDASAVHPGVLLAAAAGIQAELAAGEAPVVGVRSVIQGDGAAGVFVSAGEGAILSGISGDQLAFEVGARGDVVAQGEVTAGSFSGSGADLTEVTAANLACWRCVDSSDVDDFGIEGVDIALNTIGGAHIIPDSLTGHHISGLTGWDIYDGTISALDISDGNVLGRHLGNIYAVNVECNGGCGDSTLDEICFGYGLGELQPIAVSCSEVASPSSSHGCYPAPGNDNDNDCSPVRELTGEDPLSDFCADQGGWDAIVYCLRNEL